MTNFPDDNAFNRWLGYVPKLDAIDDIELLTLKIHVIVEDALQHLLALRLNVREKQIKDLRLRFSTLASLAIADRPPDTLRSALVALDSARNKAAHRIGSSEFHDHLRSFTGQASKLSEGSVEAGVTVGTIKQAGDAVIAAIFYQASPFWKF